MKPNVFSKISSVFVLIITLLIMLVPKADSHIRLSHIFHKQSSMCLSVVQNTNNKGFAVTTVPERNLILTIGIKDTFYMYHTGSKRFICINKAKRIQAKERPAANCKFKDIPVMDRTESTPYTKFWQNESKAFLAFTRTGRAMNQKKMRRHSRHSKDSNVFLTSTKHQDDDHTNRELRKLCARKFLSPDIKTLCKN